jgi:hypothetical protein
VIQLKEGGNAVDASRINQENVASTLKAIYKAVLPKLKLKPKDIRVLGSTGKKRPGESSGDIDLAIDSRAVVTNNKWSASSKQELTTLIEKAIKRVTRDVKASPGFGIVSLAFPIVNDDGNQEGEKVQLDLMLTDNLDFSSFAFHSPKSTESKYKGMYRNMLLMAISKSISKVLKKDADGTPIRWERVIFDLSKGLSKGVQSREGKKGITKNHKTISSKKLSDNPNEIIQMLLGPSFSVKDANSYETLSKAVNSSKFVHGRKRREIIVHFKKTLSDNDLPFPSDLHESCMISEGITHIHDLSVGVFIDTVRKMVNNDKSMEVSVKFDGNANLGIGIDNKGKLYFDRAVKGQSEKLRGPNDYPSKFVYNALRAAMAAILSKKREFEKYMEPGDYTDVEVMFEAIPNSIEYGKNIIVFHDAAFTHVVKRIRNVSGKVDLYFYDKETKKIERQDREVEFTLKGKEVVDTRKYKLSVAGDLDRLEAYLSKKNTRFKDLTNFEVMGLKSVGEWKEDIKKEKEKIAVKVKKSQVTIKDKLIDDLLSRIPASDVSPPAIFDKQGNNVGGSWPEGIVMKDLQTGQLSKVVSIFPQVNEFLWKYRKLTGQGVGPKGNYVTGIGTNLKYRIAEKVFGIKAMKTGSFVNKINADYKGQPTNAKILNYLKDNNFNFKNANRAQSEYVKAVKAAKKELEELRKDFEAHKNDVLKISKGKFKRDVKYDDVHISRTYENLISTEEQLDAYTRELQQIKTKTNEGKAVQLMRIFLGQRNLAKINENLNLVRRLTDDSINENRHLFEARGQRVGIMVGRFQPPTSLHFQLIKSMLKQNDVTYVFIAGQKKDSKNPIPFAIRKKVIKKLQGRLLIFPATTGFIPNLIKDSIDLKGVSKVTIYAGTDRAASYQRQFDDYWEHENIIAKVSELKRDPEKSVSGTKVRNAIANDDFGQFNSMFANDFSEKEKMQWFTIFKKFIK